MYYILTVQVKGEAEVWKNLEEKIIADDIHVFFLYFLFFPWSLLQKELIKRKGKNNRKKHLMLKALAVLQLVKLALQTVR